MINFSILFNFILTYLVLVHCKDANQDYSFLYSYLYRDSFNQNHVNLGKVIDQNCPVWSCSSQELEIPKDYCIYQNGSQIIVSSYFKPDACFVSHWFNKNENVNENEEWSVKVEKNGYQSFTNNTEAILKEIMDSVCGIMDVQKWRQKLKCSEFCTEDNTIPENKHQIAKCDLNKYLQTIDSNYLQNKNKSKSWSQCKNNDQCASRNCQCVPVDLEDEDSLPRRCTTSIFDEPYNKQFFQVCSVFIDLENQKAVDKYLSKACAQQILIDYGHFQEQLDQNYFNGHLRCFQHFTDYNAFDQLYYSDPSTETGMYWVFIMVGAVLLIVLCGVWIWWSNKKEAESHQYVSLENVAPEK